MIRALGFRIQGFGLRGLAFKAQGLGFRVGTMDQLYARRRREGCLRLSFQGTS